MMEFEAIVAPTIKELFIDNMIGLILSSKLTVGEKLPPERELAADMKVSKTIVHAGLTDLERLGFVTILPRIGTYVADYSEKGTQETLNAVLKFNGGRLDRHTVESMFEFRRALEGAVFERFVRVHTQEDVIVLREIVEKAKEMSADAFQYSEKELASQLYSLFHAIAQRSRNNVFPLVLNAFKTFYITFLENAICIYGRKLCVGRAEKYLDCLENCNLEGAGDLLDSDFEMYISKIN